MNIKDFIQENGSLVIPKVFVPFVDFTRIPEKRICKECGLGFYARHGSQIFCPVEPGSIRSRCENNYNVRVKRRRSRAKELNAIIEECQENGYTRQELENFLMFDNKSESVKERLKVLINDYFNNDLKVYFYYEDLFHVSSNLISRDLKLIIRKAKWLIAFKKQYNKKYQGEKNVRVNVVFLDE
jgi:hypothetical protein